MSIEKHKLYRTGERPIVFSGELIGDGSTHSHQGSSQNRWTEVKIYRTQAGKYVASVSNRTIWQGEIDYDKAGKFDTAEDVIAWLQDDEGTLGRASQEAVERAVRSEDPGFVAAWVEEVE